MGYEKCGSIERYPYDELLDGNPHIIRATSENTVRTIRYGATRRGMRLSVSKISRERYRIIAIKRR